MQPVTIRQPAPCHESWAAMTPTAQGRHCAACQTEVVDFTRMTDAEVLAFLRHTTPGRRCGMFREDQVGRPLLPAAQPVTGWRRWTVTGIMLLGSVYGIKARAQEGKPGTNPKPMEPAAGKTTAVRPDSLFLVQGVVRNRLGIRQVGVRVRLRSFEDTTNARGYFGILIPKTKRGTIRYIVVNYRKPPNYTIHLTARVPFDSVRTKPYHIRLRKAPVNRSPGFY